MVQPFDITSDSELKTAVRADTGYEDNADELTDADLDELIRSSQRRLYLRTASTDWYSDTGLGHALFAYTCMRAKSSVENIALSGYTLGDERVTLKDVDPEDSQQIQQWAEDVRVGLDASDVDASSRPSIRNTSGYIGDDYYREGGEEW